MSVIATPIGVRKFLLLGTASSLATILTTSILGLLDSIVVARIVGQERFGLFALAASILNLAMAVGSLGLPAAIVKFLAGETASSNEAARATMLGALRVACLSSVVVSVMVGVVGVFWLAPFYGDPALTPIFILTALCVAPGVPMLLFASALQGLGKIVPLNARSIVAAAIGLALSIIFSLLYSAPGAVFALAIALILPGAMSIHTTFAVIRTLPRGDSVRGVKPSALLNYGLPSLFASLAVLPALYFVNSSMAVNGGLAELGSYAVAFALASTLSFIPGALSVPLLPLLSALSVNDPDRGRSLVPRLMRLVSFVSVPAAIAMITFAPEIIAITYGAAYTPGAPALSILVTSMVVLAVSGCVGRQLAGTGRMWWTFLINLVWAITVCLLALWLIPPWGSVGAATAVVSAYALTACLSWYVGRFVLGLDFSSARPSSVWSLIFLTGTLGAVFGFADMRILLGLALLAGALLSGILLSNDRERSIARDVLRHLRLGGRST